MIWIFTIFIATKMELKTHNGAMQSLYKNPNSDLLHYESEKCIVRARF